MPIPADELAQRVYELPRKGMSLRVAQSLEAEAACSQLAVLGIESQVVAAIPAKRAEAGRLWRPSQVLEQAVSPLLPGRALDLGCGAGRDSVFLASARWNVTAIDHLPDAIDRARQLENRYGSNNSEAVNWQVRRIEDALGEEYDLVLGVFSLDRKTLSVARDAVRPGGLLLFQGYSEENLVRYGKPDPARAFRRRDFENWSGWKEISLWEGRFWSEDRYSVRAILAKDSGS